MGRSEGKAFEAEGTAMAKDLSKEEFHLHVQGTQKKKKSVQLEQKEKGEGSGKGDRERPVQVSGYLGMEAVQEWWKVTD